MSRLLRALSILVLGCLCIPAHAVDEADLLPVDQAFKVSLSAPARDRLDVRWDIADGYYLYRHRTSATVEGTGFSASGPLQLPDGKAHVDEFFGDVETYRGQLVGSLVGSAASGARRVTVQVQYQGCADAGICYPPQTRSLSVNLPAAAASGGALSLLGRALGGTAALPLPEARAFAVDAIAVDGANLLLRFTPAPGYYVYRDRTTLRLEGAEGIVVGAPQWPVGTAYRDEHFGEVTVYFGQAEVPLPLVRQHARSSPAVLRVTFQGCQDEGICYPPMTRTLAVQIPAHAGPAAPAGSGGSAPPLPGAAPGTPAAPAVGAAAVSQAAPTGAATPPTLVQVPRTLPPPDAMAPAAAAPGLALALLLALVGGLVLNLMPCVLPVLSLKALALADSGRSGGHARASALWYTAGVLVAFMSIGAVAIALRAAGQALGWGFQLQQPVVVGALAYLMFAVGLSLSGVFTLGHRFAGAGYGLTGQAGPAGDFFTGVLAVVIASPCTAPFMGAALAFAFAAPAPVALLVFAVLGLGLALPFLLIGFVPALAGRLPRPGPWMETLKQLLAFPMYLTAAWLLWVLGRQSGIDAVGLALAGLVILALGVWWYQRLRFQVAPARRALAVLLLGLALVPLVLAQRLPPVAAAVAADSKGVQPYSASALAALRAQGRVVFVEMTADWCVTCKANDRAVLSRPEFTAALAQVDAVFMRGDWTRVDPQITAFLQEHRAVGVPLYVVFPADGAAGEVLPTVLTSAGVVQALERARR